MREQWLDTLTQRQEYLDQQLQKIVSKAGAALCVWEAVMIDATASAVICRHCPLSFPLTAQCLVSAFNEKPRLHPVVRNEFAIV